MPGLPVIRETQGEFTKVKLYGQITMELIFIMRLSQWPGRSENVHYLCENYNLKVYTELKKN